MRESHGSADLAHGRRLIRASLDPAGLGRSGRGGLIVVAGVLLVPTRPVHHWHHQRRLRRQIPAGLQYAEVTYAARNCYSAGVPEMAAVAASYLDHGGYFSGFGFHSDSRYDTPGFWDGEVALFAFRKCSGWKQRGYRDLPADRDQP